MSDASAAPEEKPAPPAAPSGPRRIRYVDLTLGAWRPREAATQLAADAGIEESDPFPVDPAHSPLAAGAARIDLDEREEPVIAAAYDEATRLVRQMPAGTVVVVFAPRYELPVRADNEWFFLFLRRLGVSVALIGDTPAPTAVISPPFERRRGIAAPPWPGWHWKATPEQKRLLRLFPGLLPKALAEAHGIVPETFGLIPAGEAHFLVPAEYRDLDPRKAAAEFDLMEAIEAADDGFRAFSQSYCSAYYAQSGPLSDLAQSLWLAGSVDTARDLLERARAVARDPGAAAHAAAIRQDLRLYERRFDLAAAEPDPSRRAPAALAERIRWARGLAAAVAGDVQAAERDLAATVRRLAGGGMVGADDLYALSTIADARLKKGDLDGAATYAAAVAARLDEHPDSEERIRHRNLLTRAAIHRRRGEGDLEREALDQALETSRGARSLSEILAINVAEARNRPDPNSPEARAAWLRAAFAWLAIEPSESLSLPAATLVLAEEAQLRAQFDTEISEALAAGLQRAWPGIEPAKRNRLPAIRLVERPGMPRPTHLLSATGIGLLWSPEVQGGPIYAPSRSRLVRLALGAFAELCPPSGALEGGLILVDTNLGIDLPRNRGEALSVALRNAVEELVFGENATPLGEAERRRYRNEIMVGLAPAVAAIEGGDTGLVVRYRRHLPPRVLSRAEAELIKPVAEGQKRSLSTLMMEVSQPIEVSEATLRQLETDRVLRSDIAPRPFSLNEDRHAVGTAG